jgi:hypothetical protein
MALKYTTQLMGPIESSLLSSSLGSHLLVRQVKLTSYHLEIYRGQEFDRKTPLGGLARPATWCTDDHPQTDGQSLKGLTGRSLDSVVNLYKVSVFLSISLRLFKVRHLIRKYLGFVWFTEYILRMEWLFFCLIKVYS